jgi:uncharacterized protein YggU (UPF0235/DUF167 family)
VGLLSYLFWLEILLLFSAGVCYFSGRWTSWSRPNGLYRTFQAFWRVALSRHVGPYEVPDVARQWYDVQLAVQELQSTGGEAGDEEALLLSGWGTATDSPPVRPRPTAAAAAPELSRARDEAVVLTVRIAPQPGQPRLLGRQRDELSVQLTAQPEHGDSNRELMEAMSDWLDVRIYQVHLVSGHYRALKTLRITGLSRADVDQRLHAAEQNGNEA